jgi:acetyl/propionyl-CoA carboxylase alpha subunit
MAINVQFEVDGRPGEAEIIGRRPQLQLRLGESRHRVQALPDGAARFEFAVDGIAFSGWRYVSGDAVHVRLNGRTYIVEFPRRTHKGAGAAAQDEVRSSMPGAVIAVHTRAGERLQAGDKLLTLESMKLQMTLVASHACVVREVHVLPEAVFERGALLVSFEQEEAAGR